MALCWNVQDVAFAGYTHLHGDDGRRCGDHADSLRCRRPAGRVADWVRAPRRSQVAAFMFLRLIATIIVEVVATRSDGTFSWRYAPTMAVTPGGLMRILMWLIVPFSVLWVVHRQVGQRGARSQATRRNRAENKSSGALAETPK